MDEHIDRVQLLADIENTIRITAKDTNSSELRGARKVIDRIKAMPAAKVIAKVEYDKLLTAAKAMHTWIFLNTVDEFEVYDECGLTDEMNALLGSMGRFELKQEADDD